MEINGEEIEDICINNNVENINENKNETIHLNEDNKFPEKKTNCCQKG